METDTETEKTIYYDFMRFGDSSTPPEADKRSDKTISRFARRRFSQKMNKQNLLLFAVKSKKSKKKIVRSLVFWENLRRLHKSAYGFILPLDLSTYLI